MKRCFITNHLVINTRNPLRNMNQLIMRRGRIGKFSASSGVAETVVWNICSYQVPSIARTNTSTKKKHKFYNSKVQAISIRGGDCATKVGVLCAYFVDMGKWDQ